MEESRSPPAFQGEEVATESFFKVWLIEVPSGVAAVKVQSRCSREPAVTGEEVSDIRLVPVKSDYIWVVQRNFSISSLRGWNAFYFYRGMGDSRTF